MTNKEIEPPIKPKLEDEDIRLKTLKYDEISADEFNFEGENDEEFEERKSSPNSYKKLTKALKKMNKPVEYRYFEGFDFIRNDKVNTK